MSKYISDHVKVVLFDHDDTLVKTIGPKWDQHKHIARTYYNKVLTDEEIIRHWGKPLEQLVCLLYGSDDVKQAIAYTIHHHKDFEKILFPETIPTLISLKKSGKLVGIITATTRFSFEHDLTLHQIPSGTLDYTQTSDDTAYHKPNPRVFDPALAWLKKHKMKPGEVLYVGDGLHDMQAALGAGFNFVGVETGLVTASDFKAANATSISTIAKLVKPIAKSSLHPNPKKAKKPASQNPSL